jgi:hypothetical protein
VLGDPRLGAEQGLAVGPARWLAAWRVTVVGAVDAHPSPPKAIGTLPSATDPITIRF